MRASKSIVVITPALVVALLSSLLIGAASSLRANQEPERGLRIVLSIYSGRENPQWWITEGPLFDQLVQFLRQPAPADRATFEPEAWNQLGYTRFWIIPKGIEGAPHSVHVWRDEATVHVDGAGKEVYRIVGALPVYDLLAGQAMNRDDGVDAFFADYLEFKAGLETREE